MSGIYIPGAKIPPSCFSCDYGFSEYFGQVCPFYGARDFAEQQGYTDKRHPGCPILFVPDHGRLGDLDALAATRLPRNVHWDDVIERYVYDGPTFAQAIDMIINAPTIIPADKEENNVQ